MKCFQFYLRQIAILHIKKLEILPIDNNNLYKLVPKVPGSG